MSIIFNFEFIRENLIGFIILLLFVLLTTILTFYFASKEVKNDRN